MHDAQWNLLPAFEQWAASVSCQGTSAFGQGRFLDNTSMLNILDGEVKPEHPEETRTDQGGIYKLKLHQSLNEHNLHHWKNNGTELSAADTALWINSSILSVFNLIPSYLSDIFFYSILSSRL